MEALSTRRALSVLAVTGVAGAAIVTGLVGGEDGLGGGPDEAAALEAFSSCDEILEYAEDHEWARDAYAYGGGDVIMNAEAGAAPIAARTTALDATGAVGPSQTGTNTQEVGIDEPDIAKLSGTTLFRIQGKTLSAHDVAGEESVLLGEIDLEGSQDSPQLLIAGDKALVMATGYYDIGTTTTVTEVDISDPSAMVPLRTLDLEGMQVSARLQGSTARLVIESQPEYEGRSVEGPSAGSDPQAEPSQGSDPTVDTGEPAGATGETGPEPTDDEPAWLPQASLTDLETGETETTPIASCGDIAYPEEFSGLGLLSVLTIDLGEGLMPTDVDAVITDGSTVYASATGLYVATATIAPPRGGITSAIERFIGPDSTTVPIQPPGETAIHRFDTSDPAGTEYTSSGEVRGTLIGQFAMSEHEGVLRVASTEGDTFVDGPGESQSMLTTLAEEADSLEEIGRVGGLGPGEDIYAVRFIGDMAYVVTFEQTDPLYTVDLSVPQDPEVTGELKIPGYSAYLHPVADGRLLGIGQDGTSTGTITGAQASLFDVADPERPERLDQLALSDGRYSSTSTEWDHHAFLYSPAHALAVVPVQSYGRNGLEGAVAMRVDPEGGVLTEVARLEDADGQIERMLVTEDKLVTVSTGGVTLRDLDEL